MSKGNFPEPIMVVRSFNGRLNYYWSLTTVEKELRKEVARLTKILKGEVIVGKHDIAVPNCFKRSANVREPTRNATEAATMFGYADSSAFLYAVRTNKFPKPDLVTPGGGGRGNKLHWHLSTLKRELAIRQAADKLREVSDGGSEGVKE